ncbi:hypothetical protein STENM327S_00217 [Streptomyces tendae]
MEKAGLTPPETWTELLAFCRMRESQAELPPSHWATRTTGSPNWCCTRWSPRPVYGPDRDFDQKMQAGQATFALPWTTAG